MFTASKLSRPCAEIAHQPVAAVLACADARMDVMQALVGAEAAQPDDQIFQVRVAGNVDSVEALGSLTYAAIHLHVRTCYIIGHTCCGAVAAAASYCAAPLNLDAHLSSLVARIMPAAQIAFHSLRKQGAAPAETPQLLPIAGEVVNAAYMAYRAVEAFGKFAVQSPGVYYGVYDLAAGSVFHVSSKGKLKQGFSGAPASYKSLRHVSDLAARWALRHVPLKQS